MAYRDKAAQRDYARRWIAARRQAFFGGKVCENCGRGDGLELAPREVGFQVPKGLWSWRDERRLFTLALCVVLCQPCNDRRLNRLSTISRRRRKAERGDDEPILKPIRLTDRDRSKWALNLADYACCGLSRKIMPPVLAANRLTPAQVIAKNLEPADLVCRVCGEKA